MGVAVSRAIGHEMAGCSTGTSTGRARGVGLRLFRTRCCGCHSRRRDPRATSALVSAKELVVVGRRLCAKAAGPCEDRFTNAAVVTEP